MDLIEKYLGEARGYTLGKIGDVDVDKIFKEEVKKFLKKYPEFDQLKWHGVVKGKSMEDIIKKSMMSSLEKARVKLENLKMSKSQIEKEVRNFVALNILTSAKGM